MSEAPDFASLLEPVARELLGEPNKRLSSRHQLRFGTHGSLAVDIAGNKRGQWFDHEAQRGGGTLDLIAYKTGCANGQAAEWLIRRGFISNPDKPKRKIVATYDYRAADGALAFQVVRFEPKDFRQRRPNGNGWTWSLDGVERILYCLPELIAAPLSTPIYVVEGERDVETLRSHLLVATCNPGGAAKPTTGKPYQGKWLPAYSQYLRGRPVVILPDNDEAGEAHALDVARKLEGKASSIRILRLPNLPPKGDVSDWLAAGHTAEDLERLAADAAEWRPQSDHNAIGIWDAGEDDYNIPPRGWLLGSTFCRRFLSAVVADGGVGKTALRTAQLISLAIGRSLTGEHVFCRCRVLILSFEDGRDELRRRVYAVLRYYKINPRDLRGWLYLAAPKGLRLAEMHEGSPQPGALEQEMRDAITAFKLDVVSLDPFIKTHTLEENSNNAIDFVSSLLANIAIELDCAVDLPHHTNKGTALPGDANRGRGASAMKDAARLVYTLTPMTPDEAKLFGLSEAERRSLVRLDSGKINIAPPSREARWFKLIGVPLGNCDDTYKNGDEVQTVEPWTPSDTWAGLSSAALNAALSEIENGLAKWPALFQRQCGR
jgi:AAA domain